MELSWPNHQIILRMSIWVKMTTAQRNLLINGSTGLGARWRLAFRSNNIWWLVGLSLFSTSLPKHCCGDFLQTVFIGQLETEGFVGHQTKEQEEVDQPNLGGTNQTLRADNSSIGSSANPGFNGIVYCSKWKFFVACVSFISVTNGFPSRISVLELKPFLTVGHDQHQT